MEDSQWKGKTEGTQWMHKALIQSFKYLNLRFVYCGMAILVIPFYMLFAHRGYISMYHFFRKRFGFSPIKSFLYVYKNHFRFGQIILDRFAFYAGKKFDFSIENYDAFQEKVKSSGGMLIVSSHIGNYELAGYTLKAKEKRFNAVVFSGEAEMVMKNRNKFLTGNNISMIPVSDDMSHIFKINNALEEGDVVSIPGDRIFGSPRYVECDFFGSKAKFPLGPFVLAVQRNVPAIAIFVMKTSTMKYNIHIRQLIVDEPCADKKERVKKLAQKFASTVEKIIRIYPEQWFNYYEFWN
jgi:predicted LPLAT superfamily acyltransferase